MTAHQLIIPSLNGTGSVRKFCRDTQEAARVVAQGWNTVADQCIADWRELPLDRGRLGRGPEARAVRQLRYGAKLLWRLHDSSGLLYRDYMDLIDGPLRVGTTKRPKWDINR